MKKYYFVFIALYLLTITNVNAKIWIVANNGLPADFTTLQDAHDGASAGDTIHVLGSKQSYGNLTCTKQLHIFGPGYTLITNQPGILPITAQAQTITFNSGSEFSTFEGLALNGINIRASDITIKRCELTVILPKIRTSC